MNGIQLNLFDLLDAATPVTPAAPARPMHLQASSQMHGESGFCLYGASKIASMNVATFSLDAAFMFTHFGSHVKYYIRNRLADPRETIDLYGDYIAGEKDAGQPGTVQLIDGTWIYKEKGAPPALIRHLSVAALYEYAERHPDALNA